MKGYSAIGYAYDADLHCADCTRKRFPDAADDFADVVDSEGNDIHPVFAMDEHDDCGEYCGDCLREIWEPADEGTTDDE